MSKALAKKFHYLYEKMAPGFGYETRPDTKMFDPNSQNGQLMIAVTNEIEKEIYTEVRTLTRRLNDAITLNAELVNKIENIKNAVALTAKLVNKIENIENADAVKGYDISGEAWREYDFSGSVYTITNPKVLYMRDGGITHRVLDGEGIVHCLPAPGTYGCVLRWKSKDPNKPVQF